jgi:hypothetical protein
MGLVDGDMVMAFKRNGGRVLLRYVVLLVHLPCLPDGGLPPYPYSPIA